MHRTNSENYVGLCCGDDELGAVYANTVKLEPDSYGKPMLKQKGSQKNDPTENMRLASRCRNQGSEENRSTSALSTGLSSVSGVDQEQSPADDGTLCSSSPVCAAPLCRQFWSAGNYEHTPFSKPAIQSGTSYLSVHPKFLHSNATSHKWVFGAIAELLDNAVDEIQNGATFVIVDKTLNPRDGSPALLIQDDGGGMDLEAMRRCLSFGFSDKSKSAIGQYGNGFKTSSMRLGADVIVFSRHVRNRKVTQSIGLLSYTFLTQTNQNRIVVPMVDYELEASTGTVRIANQQHEHFRSNISTLLQWSPYSTEAELLKQFDDIGFHGTKVIIYNLWFNDEGNLELDFESDPEDIHIAGHANITAKSGSRMSANEQHLANRLRYSLRVYLSVLYLRVPQNFCMLLRGRVVEYHNIGSDLKYPEFIVYRPQSGGLMEGTVVTTIGFLKEAPHVNIHGFNVYHKNRLILPFWHVVSYSDSRGRGVVGVLEANFIEPTHNKQDFEKTSVFQKLEARLKEMTREYWDYHCGLLGYQVKKFPSVASRQGLCDSGPNRGTHQPVFLNKSFSPGGCKSPGASGATQCSASPASNYLGGPGKSLSGSHENSKKGTHPKRKELDHSYEPENMKRKVGSIHAGSNLEILPTTTTENQSLGQEATNLIEENKRLHSQCLEHMKREKELDLKVTRLKSELGEAQSEYARLLAIVEGED